MKRLGMLLLLAAFSLSIAAEARELHCDAGDAAAACCVCVCHSPALGSGPALQSGTLLNTEHYVPVPPPFYSTLLVKSIFNPPRFTA